MCELAASLRGRPFRHDLAALWPTAGVAGQDAKAHTPSYWDTPAGGSSVGITVMTALVRNGEQASCEPDQDHPVIIRPATVADQLAIAELNVLVQQMHHDVAPAWFKPPEMEAIVDYFRQALRSDALRAFVVEADGAVRGYALARLQKQPETALTYGGLVVELDQISVDPAYRGRGFAQQLIDQVRSLASEVGADRLQLTVWEFNEHARDVFERAGFTAMTTRMVASS